MDLINFFLTIIIISYKYRRKFEFKIGDLIYLKVSLIRSVIRFGKKGKLNLNVRRTFPSEKAHEPGGF